MTIIDGARTLLIKHGEEPRCYDPEDGRIFGDYGMNTTHEIICALADICNRIGAQLRLAYQVTAHGRTRHFVSIFHQDHPDWIGAFINKLVIHAGLDTITVAIMLSNFEVKTQHYTAQDTELSFEENPVSKIGYRIVLHSLQTQGFLNEEGEEIFDINDYVGAEDNSF